MALQDLIQISSWLKMDFWNFIQINSRLKPSRISIQINSRLKKNVYESWFESSRDSMMLFIPSFVWPFLGIQLDWWLDMTFWRTFHSSDDFVWPFWGFRLKGLPDLLIWISSWFKRYLRDSNRFNSWLKRLSRSWLRVNSRLKWIPLYWFRLTHDSKYFPTFRFKSTHDSSEKTYDSESTHDSTLSHTQVWM